MRILDEHEIDAVGGGNYFSDVSVAGGAGAAIGGMGGFSVGALAGYTSTAALAVVSAQGAAVGMVVGAWGYSTYSLATAAGAGEVGASLGSWLAKKS